MVSDTVLGAAIGVSGAVIGSLLTGIFNWLSTQQRIRAEKQRYHAEIYAGEKVKALAQLHSQFVECRQIMSKQLGRRADDLTEEDVQEEILPLVDSLQAALDKATIFLNEDQINALSDAYLSISTAGEFLEREAQGGADDMLKIESSTLIEQTESAIEVLEKEINNPIENFEADD